MTVTPVIDASWHRLPEDAFGAGPSSHTPLDPACISTEADSDGSGSEWSYCDDEELITLDLGTERIAKRALLGYSAGLDLDTDAPSLPHTRSVRGFRASADGAAVEADKRTKRGSTDSSPRVGNSNGPHLGAGKQLSITGLDTSTPLMKIGDTVLRGSNMAMFGTEIALVDDFDPTRARGKQHRLQPIPPSTQDGRANVTSTTTRKRILFRPIYDPKAREAIGSNEDAYAKLRAIADLPAQQHGASSDSKVQEEQASLADLMGASTEASLGREGEDGPSQWGVGKGKYKRKEISEEEQMIRAAERKIRKAAKLHLKQQQEQQQQRGVGTQSEGPEEAPNQQREEEGGQDDSTASQQPRPPPSYEQP